MVSTTSQGQISKPITAEKAKSGRNLSIESAISKAIHDLCQHDHLSGLLFPLNDVLIRPRLLARIRFPSPDENPQYVPVLFQSLPNLYDSPQLVSSLPYPSISIDKAFQFNHRLAVCGYPGSGRTTMLTDLASRICSRDADLEELNTFLPLYVHCRNLLFSSQTKGNIFFPLLRYASVITKNHDEKSLAATLMSAAAENQLILLLDGLDELTPGTASTAIQWLAQLTKEFPALRIATTTYPFSSLSIASLGFNELSVAPWTNAEKSTFIDKFATAWSSTYQQPEGASFIPGWLKSSNLPNTPLDLTLTCWSAFTGNQINLQGTTIFDPYLTSSCNHPLSITTLGNIATVEFESGFSGITQADIENLIAKDPIIKSIPLEKPVVESSQPLSVNPVVSDVTPRSVLNEYLSAGILTRNVQGRYFIKSDHLCAALYIQTSLPKFPNTWQAATQFSFINSLLLFACASGKLNARVSQWLNEVDFPLFRNFQIISHWLTSDPSQVKGLLVEMYKKVIVLLQKSSLPISLQIKLLSPLLLSREQATFSFFSNLASSTNPLTRKTAAFCLSFYPSTASDPLLLSLGSDSELDVQKLACISLAKSWSTQAQKKLVNLITSGVPEIRQLIGELFAFVPVDGPELLKELAVLPNNPEARKASVDGLLLIGTDWSKTLIKKVNIDDSEWLVRDTAANAIKLDSIDHLYKIKPNIAPANLAWLIKFAAARRMGIYADEFPTDILIKAATDGDSATQSAAVDTLSLDSSPESIRYLKQVFLNGQGLNQELAYTGLQALSRRGVNLQK